MKAIKQYSHLGYAGLVERHVSRQTGTTISVYHTDQAKMGAVADGDAPWTLTCEEHHWNMGCYTLAQARSQMRDPLGWCGVCNGQVCATCGRDKIDCECGEEE